MDGACEYPMGSAALVGRGTWKWHLSCVSTSLRPGGCPVGRPLEGFGEAVWQNGEKDDLSVRLDGNQSGYGSTWATASLPSGILTSKTEENNAWERSRYTWCREGQQACPLRHPFNLEVLQGPTCPGIPWDRGLYLWPSSSLGRVSLMGELKAITPLDSKVEFTTCSLALPAQFLSVRPLSALPPLRKNSSGFLFLSRPSELSSGFQSFFQSPPHTLFWVSIFAFTLKTELDKDKLLYWMFSTGNWSSIAAAKIRAGGALGWPRGGEERNGTLRGCAETTEGPRCMTSTPGQFLLGVDRTQLWSRPGDRIFMALVEQHFLDELDLVWIFPVTHKYLLPSTPFQSHCLTSNHQRDNLDLFEQSSYCSD